MPNIRAGYELQRLAFGRTVRPFHLAVTIATSVIAWTNLFIPAPLADQVNVGIGLGVAAAASSVLLTVGWWARSDRAAEWGLLLAVGTWLTRAVYVLLTGDGVGRSGIASAVLSVAWTIGAGGAYLLERYESEVARAGE